MPRFFVYLFCIFLLISGCGSSVEDSSTSPNTSREGTDLSSTTTVTSTTEDIISFSTTSTTSATSTTSTTSTTTTEPLDPETVLLVASYEWMESSDRVAELQRLLDLGDDGVYGSGTRSAHINENEERGLGVDMIPVPPVEINPVNVALVAPGMEHIVRGTGFAPGSTATVTLYSDPVFLGSTTVGNNGTVSLAVEIPSNTLIGNHTLELSGESFTGEVTVVSTPIVIGIDEEPPWLSGLSVSTTSVDVTNGAASVVVEMTVGDSGSGVRGGGVFFSCEGGDISNPPFSGSMSFNVDGSYNGALVSGDVYNGVWRGTFNVPAGTPACTMSMTHIEVVDALNHYVRWNGPGCPEEYVSCDEPSVTTIGITPPTITVVRTD